MKQFELNLLKLIFGFFKVQVDFCYGHVLVGLHNSTIILTGAPDGPLQWDGTGVAVEKGGSFYKPSCVKRHLFMFEVLNID